MRVVVLICGVLVGLAFIVYQDQLARWIVPEPTSHDKSTPIAVVISVEGMVERKYDQTLQYDLLKINSPIYHLDTIVTGANGFVDIRFGDKNVVRVKRHSRVVVESLGSQRSSAESVNQMTVLTGQVDRIEASHSNWVKIIESPTVQKRDSHMGLKQIQSQYDQAQKAAKELQLEQKEVVLGELQLEDGLAQNLPPKLSPDRLQRAREDRLSNESIAQVIQGQKSFFNRCYVQHLKRKPDSRGEIAVSFSIMSSGRMNRARILNSTIPDEKLKACVLEVLNRCRFRPFSGAPIEVTYPLKFD